MQRVMICAQFGGFGLSRQAFLRLREMGNAAALAEPDYGEMFCDGSGPRKDYGFADSFCSDIPRDDTDLMAVFEEMGQDAAGHCCTLKVIEIPDGVEWEIESYDGSETVAEAHRVWG